MIIAVPMASKEEAMKNMNRWMLCLLAVFLLVHLFVESQVLPCNAETKLIASDAVASDNFGYSASINGDTLVVGAYGDEGNTGSAHVFKRSGSGWVEVAKLTADDAAPSDLFGVAVSINSDTLVVGAPLDDNGRGSAYVFKYDGTAWAQVAKLIADDGAPYDYFGISVAISGDTIVAGAYGDSWYMGSAYVFTYDGTSWAQVAKLTAGDGGSYDFFGMSVCINGETIVIGAPGDGASAGSAYVFRNDGTDWVRIQKIEAAGGESMDSFGTSISVSGDTMVIGAPGDAASVGAAYVFKDDGVAWGQVKKLTATDGASPDYFGYSVSIDGDMLVVGAYGDESNTGSGYLFKYDGTTWAEAEKLLAGDAAPSDFFGVSISISGGTAVIGAFGDEGSAGAAYVFEVGEVPPVDPELEVYVDIKPGSCVNPFNPKSLGVLPVAVLGTADFDVTTVDPASIRFSREGVEGDVPAVRWGYGDVAKPLQCEKAECDGSEGDGYVDLKLKFKTQKLVKTLQLWDVAGQTVTLTLTGNLKEEFGGTPFTGQDSIKVLRKKKKH